MKKSIYLSLFVAFVAMIFSSNSMAQATRQGNIIIDPYYGGPNFGKAFLSAVEDAADGANNFETRGIGPAGLRVEYMLGDQIGLGIDVIYNSNNISYTETDSVYNNNGYQVETNTYEQDMKRLRVHVRFNYHFDISNPNLDGYFGVGAGTNNRFRTAYENGNELEDTGLEDFTLIPFSARICVGTRYFFTDNFGLNCELGLGGPVISGGLSIKF